MDKNCEMCKKTEAKYKCPGCDISTCSLACVKEHKSQHKCSGVRDKLKMVEKYEMDNLSLLSDYRFLEEIDHKLEDGNRMPLRKQIVKKEMFEDLPPHLKRLKTEARKRSTILEFMPQHFSKHSENTTRFNFKEGKIRWHIKWVFPQADVTFIDANVPEDKRIVDLLRKYMEPREELDDSDSSVSDDKISLEDSNKLEYYQSASYRRIAVLLRTEMCLYDDRFIEMFLSRSLKDNFANRKIVEYPVMYVVMKDHLDAYLVDKPEQGFQDLLNEGSVKKIKKEKFEDLANKSDVAVPTISTANRTRTFFDEFSDCSD